MRNYKNDVEVLSRQEQDYRELMEGQDLSELWKIEASTRMAAVKEER